MSSAKQNKSHLKSFLHHPVQIEKIPHIVTAITLMYMFGFVFIALGVVVGSYINTQNSATEINSVEYAPNSVEQDFEPFYYEEEYRQESVLGQDAAINQVPLYKDEPEIYYQVDGENVNIDNEYDLYPVEYSEDDYIYNESEDPYLSQDYYDEDYYNYWEEELGNDMYYGDSQPINDVTQADIYVAEPLKTNFMVRFNSTVTSDTLLYIGFSVLVMGILVFVVNHIHENNHFSHKNNKVLKKK